MTSLSLPKPYQRLGAFSIDDTDVFQSLAEMEAYVSGASSYAGHLIALVDQVGNTVGIYVVLPDKTYQSIFSEALTLGEIETTAYRGDRGKIAYDHTSKTDNPHAVTKSQVGLSNVDNTADADKPVSTAQQTALNNKADLVLGVVPSNQLPSFVDDVLEFDDFASFPEIGEAGKVYLDKTENKTYRWSGTVYVVIGSDLALGETETTAYRGDRGKIAYDHTSKTDNPHAVTKSQVGLSNVDNTADADKPVSTAQQAALNNKADLVDGKVNSEQIPTTINEHPGDTNNPHAVTKSQVGLSNVDNTADADKPVSTAQQAALTAISERVSPIETKLSNGTIPQSEMTTAFSFGGHVKSGGLRETFSTIASFDGSAKNSFEMLLSSNLTSISLTNKVNGSNYEVILIQDATGNRTIPEPDSTFGTKSDNAADFDITADSINHISIKVLSDGTTYWTNEVILN